MLAQARKNKIKDIVYEKKSITVAELAKQFTVTEETFRRDLKSLEDMGLLKRTYGGAFIQDGVANDINVSVREDILVPNKKIIAKQCGKLIKNGDTISLGASTTAFHICNEVKDKRITVLTHSINIINFLKDFDNINLIVTGGTVVKKGRYFAGKIARQIIAEHYVDKAFISCRSIDMTYGITEANEELAEIRKMLVERANKVFLIADHSKFDRVSFTSICGFEMVDALVVDKRLSPEWKTFLQKKQVEIFEPAEKTQ